jgi:hypothetical protein
MRGKNNNSLFNIVLISIILEYNRFLLNPSGETIASKVFPRGNQEILRMSKLQARIFSFSEKV